MIKNNEKSAEILRAEEQLLYAYRELQPYVEYHKTSNSMKGFVKRNYDKAHQTGLASAGIFS